MEVFLSNHAETQAHSHLLQVLIVDAQDIFRRKIRDILHGIGGFQVVAETASCQMALETVGRMRIDLVIAELALDDGDWPAFLMQLKQFPGAPRVILFSSILHDPVLLQAMLAGADGYLLKDTPTRDIVRALKNLERGGPALQPAMTSTVIRLLAERCKHAELFPTLASEQHATLTSLLMPDASGKEDPNGVGPVQPSRLSPQEEKVFALLRQGQRNKQIAAHLAISPYTVGKHVQSILRKLGVVNRTQAAAYTSNEG